jgi:hypothetical protein
VDWQVRRPAKASAGKQGRLKGSNKEKPLNLSGGRGRNSTTNWRPEEMYFEWPPALAKFDAWPDVTLGDKDDAWLRDAIKGAASVVHECAFAGSR